MVSQLIDNTAKYPEDRLCTHTAARFFLHWIVCPVLRSADLLTASFVKWTCDINTLMAVRSVGVRGLRRTRVRVARVDRRGYGRSLLTAAPMQNAGDQKHYDQHQ